MLTPLQTCFFVSPEQKYDFDVKETSAAPLYFTFIFPRLRLSKE